MELIVSLSTASYDAFLQYTPAIKTPAMLCRAIIFLNIISTQEVIQATAV